ncbi:MAG: tetratricopeptide repeat protein, partial [Armatimonadetes bacterium]|nr:tetratricopeptide repeat protein [Armatimonadota bacterium]
AKVVSDFKESDFVPQALFGMGWARLQRNDYEGAGTVLDELTAKYPRHPLVPDALLARAHCFYNTKRYDEALPLYQRLAASDNPQLAASAGLWEGNCLLAQGKGPAAVDGLSKLVERLGQQGADGSLLPEAYLRLGDAHAAAESYPEARKAYQAVLDGFPNSKQAPEARYGVGFTLYQEKKLPEAMKVFEEIVRVAPDSDYARRVSAELGAHSFQEQKYDEALQHYQ